MKQLQLDVSLDHLNDALVDMLNEAFKKHSGNVPVQFNVHENGTRLEMPSRSVRVDMNRELEDLLEKMDRVRWTVDKSWQNDHYLELELCLL